MSDATSGSGLFCTAALLTAASVMGLVICSAAQASVSPTGEVTPTYDNSDPWNVAFELIVGETTAGSLVIDGTSEVTSSRGIIGDQAGSSGEVKVSDTGASWEVTTELYVGESGAGELLIVNGGAVTADDLFMGSVTGATGLVALFDAGSALSLDGMLEIGGFGDGTFVVRFGASATVANSTVVGQAFSSDSELRLADAGSILTTQSLFVGLNGSTALLDIRQSARVEVAGQTAVGSNGSIDLSSSGTLMTGGIAVDSSGTFSWTGGTLHITGFGLSIESASDAIDTVTLGSGKTLRVDNDLDIRTGGSLTLAGGVLQVGNNLERGGSGTDGAFSFTGGRLEVGREINFALDQQGGTFAPGNFESETTILGDYTLAQGATLEIELGADPASAQAGEDFDFLFVLGGDVTLNGTLDVQTVAGYTPQAGDSFVVVEVGLSEDTLNIDGLTLTPGSGFRPVLDTTFDHVLRLVAVDVLGDIDGDGHVGATDLDLLLANWGNSVVNGDLSSGDLIGDGTIGQSDLAVVLANWGDGTPPDVNIPEPGSLALLGLGGMVLLRRRP